MRAAARAPIRLHRGSSETGDLRWGLDNDNNGRVDVDTVTGSLLKRPCWTACGAGFETCTRGVYQSCSAPAVFPETCNGRDDNCDGLVDNGVGQLDCTAGNGVLPGQVPACPGPDEVSASLASHGARLALQGGWGGHGTALVWRNGTLPPASSGWKSGSGDFGNFPSNDTWSFSTTLADNSKWNIWTRYSLRASA